MIQYMPFSYLPEALVGPLTDLLGPLAVCQPLQSLVPDHMRTAADQGSLQLYFPENPDPSALERAFRSFAAWADLHNGKIGDMAGFFRSSQWPGAGMQDPGTHQIRSEIRRWSGEPRAAETQDPLFQDALFLALAHRYDQQHDTVIRDLGRVETLEKRFGQILGDLEDERVTLGPAWSADRDTAAIDPGLFMTERRMQAWARLAGHRTSRQSVFVTTSRAVWEALLECFPEAVEVLQMSFDPRNREAAHADRLAGWLADLVAAEDPGSVSKIAFPMTAADGPRGSLVLHVLAGCPMHMMLDRLVGEPNAPQADAPFETFPNTVIGYVRMRPDGI